ncbi:hypothetical protein KIN20_027205 [Parelaphostrongylus tenuis]|uniref:Uncharacterized protein n=1 Tax=Parelaphostrongylus tenuis TaxID=148309 RepID=A0AAD5QZ43_PARTN|nr:hypothetical protein KIN20_027205 [Parelaphostrongylus tenuis]
MKNFTQRYYRIQDDYHISCQRWFKLIVVLMTTCQDLKIQSLQKLCNFVASSTRTFTASGTSNLPIIAVYTDRNEVSALVPGIATSKGAVQALAQRFAMQTVVDVLEIEGRRALLPDFVISSILGQLQVNTTYEPLLCHFLRGPGQNQFPIDSCIFVGSTVTRVCPKDARAVLGVGGGMQCDKVAMPINSEHLSLSGSLTTTNIVMANWSRSMWQNVVDRALRMLRSGPFGSHLYTVTVTVS